ncbi:MAG: hypothetical protein H6R18_2266 [Proteobacteria bacterium]|nr:hypothetical protein [Pseudomonadota bacterium]
MPPNSYFALRHLPGHFSIKTQPNPDTQKMKISISQDQKYAISQILKIFFLLFAAFVIFVVGHDAGKNEALDYLTAPDITELQQKQQQRKLEMRQLFDKITAELKEKEAKK